jgi:hypothetical protein
MQPKMGLRELARWVWGYWRMELQFEANLAASGR